MRIPAHWSKGTVEDTDRDGRRISFSCWRSSDRSVEDAHESALAAAKRILQSLAGGRRLDRYSYGETPLREEVIERFADTGGELPAAVTRNAYGALVLNTARVMFIDLDFPPISAGEQLKYFFTKLFSRSARSPDEQRESDIRGRLEQFLGEHSDWGIRVYRTFAGLRALVTHDLFDPGSDSTLAVFQSVGADPLYVRLCKAQQCFRARLTPKPWRCGLSANTVGWPREGKDAQDRFEQWLSTYKTSQSGYATCRYLGTIGRGTVHPAVENIIEVHDKVTRCGESLELA
jgi:hypothetical protein